MDIQFQLKVIGEAWDTVDDNIDVQIDIDDGRVFSATFFTLQNIETLFRKNAQTGECASGLYFWASEMILVKDLKMETIHRAVKDLILNNELQNASLRIR